VTTQAVARLVLRIWSVMLLVKAVIAAPALVSLLMQSTGQTLDANVLFSARLSTFASVGVQIVVALLMFRTAPTVARWIAGPDEDVSIAVDSPTLLSVGLAIFGVTVLVDGIIELGPAAYAWLMTPGDSSANASFMVERRWSAISRGTLEILIGVALFIGRDGMVRVWRTLRSQD
jgi:hypothetical protein